MVSGCVLLQCLLGFLLAVKRDRLYVNDACKSGSGIAAWYVIIPRPACTSMAWDVRAMMPRAGKWHMISMVDDAQRPYDQPCARGHRCAIT
jgi:hypothetical protein